jgi:hypothetical protein
MMTAAGSLVDAGKPIVMDSWEDAPDSWIEWLGQSLPASSSRWLADLRSPVPIDAESFDEISPLDAWNDPSPHDYDRVIGLVEGSLPEWVVVAAGAETSRPDGYAGAYVTSALVGPDHADDLRRAIAAASYARDLKLPSEGDEEYETEHGRFVLRGWLSESTDYAPSGTLEEHDPYAHVLRKNVPLPGRVPRQASQLVLDPAGFALLAQDGTAVAHAEQWSDPSTEDLALALPARDQHQPDCGGSDWTTSTRRRQRRVPPGPQSRLPHRRRRSGHSPLSRLALWVSAS